MTRPKLNLKASSDKAKRKKKMSVYKVNSNMQDLSL